MAGSDLGALVRRVVDLSARLDLVPSLRWGTVRSTIPLAVLLDGDTSPVQGLDALASVSVAQRVLVARWNRRGVITGARPTGPVDGDIRSLLTPSPSYDPVLTSARVEGRMVFLSLTPRRRTPKTFAAWEVDPILTVPPGLRPRGNNIAQFPFHPDLALVAHSDGTVGLQSQTSNVTYNTLSWAGQIFWEIA